MRTHLCDILNIEYPIIQAGMAVFTSAELAAAVSNAGGLGSLGAWQRPPEDLLSQIARTKGLTDKPFAVNFVVPAIDEATFERVLAEKPVVISLSIGDPGDWAKRARDAGITVMHQATTVDQALHAAEDGVDIIIAQGGEAGGYGAQVATLPLIPQVVDAVSPLPVVAAGGISDGRGLAAALVMGAEGVNVGTRFLASVESPINADWKQMFVEAASEDAVKVEFWNDIRPMSGTTNYRTAPRALRTPFIDRWQGRRTDLISELEQVQGEVGDAIKAGRLHEFLPGSGQSAGMIREILPVGDIISRIISEAEEAFAGLSKRNILKT